MPTEDTPKASQGATLEQLALHLLSRARSGGPVELDSDERRQLILFIEGPDPAERTIKAWLDAGGPMREADGHSYTIRENLAGDGCAPEWNPQPAGEPSL